jgi:F-type H+-transporting ATPase subunit delta
MSEFVTVARPYAKAAFDFAVEHQNVDRWQDMLAFAAEVTKNEQMAELLSGALAPETPRRVVYRRVRRATGCQRPEPD